MGVDVSKAHLDAYIHPLNKNIKISNTKKGIDKLIAFLSKYFVEKVAFESTGGYENLLRMMLFEASYNAWCIDPKRIKAFIRSQGIKAKTDRIDAKMIAKFAEKNSNSYEPVILDKKALELKAYMRRRIELIEIISSEKKRKNNPTRALTEHLIRNHIEFLEKEVESVDEHVQLLISENSKWQLNYKIMTSVPGIGGTTAATLMAYVPEIGSLSSKQIGALVGVVPYSKQSGTHQGKEFIQEGRFIPRKALYMAALSAINTKSVFKDFYQKLTEKGKAPKVAVVATMRKMIIVVNSMIKKQETYS